MSLLISQVSSSMPHLMFTFLMAVAVAAIAAFLGKRSLRKRLAHAGYLVACSVASVVAGSWVMYFIHG